MSFIQYLVLYLRKDIFKLRQEKQHLRLPFVNIISKSYPCDHNFIIYINILHVIIFIFNILIILSTLLIVAIEIFTVAIVMVILASTIQAAFNLAPP